MWFLGRELDFDPKFSEIRLPEQNLKTQKEQGSIAYSHIYIYIFFIYIYIFINIYYIYYIYIIYIDYYIYLYVYIYMITHIYIFIHQIFIYTACPLMSFCRVFVLTDFVALLHVL